MVTDRTVRLSPCDEQPVHRPHSRYAGRLTYRVTAHMVARSRRAIGNPGGRYQNRPDCVVTRPIRWRHGFLRWCVAAATGTATVRIRCDSCGRKRFGHHKGVPGVGTDLDPPVVESFFVEQSIEPPADLPSGGVQCDRRTAQPAHTSGDIDPTAATAHRAPPRAVLALADQPIHLEGGVHGRIQSDRRNRRHGMTPLPGVYDSASAAADPVAQWSALSRSGARETSSGARPSPDSPHAARANCWSSRGVDRGIRRGRDCRPRAAVRTSTSPPTARAARQRRPCGSR